MSPPARLTALAPDAVLVTVAGRVDLRHGQELRETLLDAVADGAARVVVDAVGAEIVDPVVLSTLYDAARAMRERHGVVALVAPVGTDLRRVVDTTGLAAAFQLYETRAAALDDLDLEDPPG